MWCTDSVVQTYLCCPSFLCCSCWISSKTSLLYIIHGPICAALLVRSVSLSPNQLEQSKSQSWLICSIFLLVGCFYCAMKQKKKVCFCLLLSGHCGRSETRTWFPSMHNCVYLVKSMHLPLWGSTHWSPGLCCILGIHLISTAGHASEKAGPFRLSQD